MKHLWFKAKNYGWGWYPVTWEGWVVIGVYLVLLWGIVNGSRMYFGEKYFIIPYLIAITTITIILLTVCFLTGEKPEWRWGPPKKKKKR